MRDDYRVFVHTEALDVLPKSGRRRETVIAFLRDLGHRWSLGGDYKEEEPQTGRSVNVTEIMGFAVTWWVDDPVLEVKVVDIRIADDAS